MTMRPVLPLVLLMAAFSAFASGPLKNGNEFALRYTESTAEEKSEVRKASVGQSLFFRYLKVESILKGETNGVPFISMSTVEPSSYMNVEFVVTAAWFDPKKKRRTPRMESGGIGNLYRNKIKTAFEEARAAPAPPQAPRSGPNRFHKASPCGD